jgi:diaminohydroxyphosphoribosylaminopyrimidine deaminase/5-amino-6-(5-phosphoribosylamino)uracil reductase
MTFDADDHRQMARALQLAERGLHSTDPNPRVGCVLVRDGEVVGAGWHEKAGEPHAEAHALRDAGERARRATAYVTLEPCAHHGRTPPCADALVEAGIARVVYAVGDPFPPVDGAGAARLRAAGIAVEEGCLRAQAEALNPGFLKRLRSGRPFVRVKLAASLDGRTALANGASRWITGEAARADVQRLRARSSAILAGARTVQLDGARLTVRDPALDLRGRRPLRVVLDPRLEVGTDAALFGEPGPVLIVTSGQALERRGPAGSSSGAAGTTATPRNPSPEVASVEIAAVPAVAAVPLAPAATAALDLESVLDVLAKRQVNELLVESGPKLAGAFLAAGLVDELVLYLAPYLLGDDALPLARLPRLDEMTRRTEFRILDVRQVGGDLRLTLGPAPRGDRR